MDYKEKYENALEGIQEILNSEEDSITMSRLRVRLQGIFPELKDDDRIRNEIIAFVEQAIHRGGGTPIPQEQEDMWIAWLEKQGNLTNKVNPKFHDGEWITDGEHTWKIVEVKPLDYILQSQDGNIVDDDISYVDKNFHLWTIKDAKKYDVLYCKSESEIDFFVMYKCINEHDNVDSYFRYNSWDGFGVDIPSVLSAKDDTITPATKEQCGVLFKKMEEAGCAFDFNNLKKLKNLQENNKL